jgi:uncharacterized phage-associated protein
MKSELLLVDNLFGNWYALPKGPVEDFCYGQIKPPNTLKSDANKFGTDNDNINSLDSIKEGLDPKITNAIDEAIQYLKKNLLLLDEEQLVEISHRWSAWRSAFLNANLRGKNAAPMNIADIKKDPIYI